MKRARFFACTVASLGFAFVLSGGCFTPPVGYEGAGRMQALPPLATEATTLGSDAFEGGLGALPGACIPNGVVCKNSFDCCNNTCDKGSCGASASGQTGICAPNGVVCVDHGDCCGGYCAKDGVCGSPNSPLCLPVGVRCGETKECCNAQQMTDGPPPPGAVCVPSKGNSSESYCVDTSPTSVRPSDFPLCVPYGEFCTPNVPNWCCVGACVLNRQDQFVCDVSPM